MEEIRKIILSLIIFSFMSLGWGLVQLEIENVNVNDDNSGTLDIYMSNIPSCSYCENWVYNNIYEFWNPTMYPNGDVNVGMKRRCEAIDMGNSTWIVDTEMTEEECGDVPDLVGEGVPGAGLGGWWFDGNVAGFQFFIDGMTVTEISGGISSEYFNLLLLNSDVDCDGDGILDEGCNLILGADTNVQLIPPSNTNVLLITINFEDFNGIGICFAGSNIELSEVININWSPPVVGDPNGQAAPLEWGNCYTLSEVVGCTYIHATNYNPDATDDDGSCEFMWGDVNHDGELNIQDLISIVNEILSF